jgi:hypothetical protein
MTGGTIRANEYSIASAYGTSIYHGDVVEMTGTCKNVSKAAATNVDNIGVFAGCRYVNSAGQQIFSKYWPASTTATDIVAFVYDDPNILFSVQCDSLAEAAVGTLIDWNVGTGSTVTGYSGLYAVGSSTATADQSLRVMGLLQSPDNAYGAYAKAEVSFAEHALKGVVAGVGGI